MVIYAFYIRVCIFNITRWRSNCFSLPGIYQNFPPGVSDNSSWLNGLDHSVSDLKVESSSPGSHYFILCIYLQYIYIGIKY